VQDDVWRIPEGSLQFRQVGVPAKGVRIPERQAPPFQFRHRKGVQGKKLAGEVAAGNTRGRPGVPQRPAKDENDTDQQGKSGMPTQ